MVEGLVMKRRSFLQALLGAPAVVALPVTAKPVKRDYSRVGRIAISRRGALSACTFYDYEQLKVSDGYLLIKNSGWPYRAIDLSTHEIIGITLPRVCNPAIA